MAERIPQSATIRVLLKLYLSSDHVTNATGKTVAVTISKNGAAFGNPSAGTTNATEIANGWYYVDLSTTDTGTLGPLIVRGTAGSCDDSEVYYTVVNANTGGLAALPNHAPSDAALITTVDVPSAPANFAALQITAGGYLAQPIQKNVALNNFEFPMFSSADHATPTAGLSVTATRSIDGAAFGACANSVVEVGGGTYKINLAAADLNGAVITFAFAATGADTQYVTIVTQPT